MPNTIDSSFFRSFRISAEQAELDKDCAGSLPICHQIEVYQAYIEDVGAEPQCVANFNEFVHGYYESQREKDCHRKGKCDYGSLPASCKPTKCCKPDKHCKSSSSSSCTTSPTCTTSPSCSSSDSDSSCSSSSSSKHRRHRRC